MRKTEKTSRTNEDYGDYQDGHLIPEHVRDVQPSALGCEDCLKTGGHWIHLRICTECGHVGCCDQSPNRHATSHFHATHHPIIRSFEPYEAWGYCYVDDQYFETMGPPANTYGKHFGETNE